MPSTIEVIILLSNAQHSIYQSSLDSRRVSVELSVFIKKAELIYSFRFNLKILLLSYGESRFFDELRIRKREVRTICQL